MAIGGGGVCCRQKEQLGKGAEAGVIPVPTNTSEAGWAEALRKQARRSEKEMAPHEAEAEGSPVQGQPGLQNKFM